jgi:general secretion pathway protein M
MKQWLAGLDPRERRLVLGGAVVVGCLLIYVLAWEPFATRVAQLRAGHGEQQALLQWMQNAAQEVQQLRRASGRPAQAVSGQSLLAVIDRTAKTGHLASALKRVQPDGEQRVRVWLEDAAFDDVMRWLQGLERQGIRVENSVFEAKELGGHVDGRLVLAGGGA